MTAQFDSLPYPFKLLIGRLYTGVTNASSPNGDGHLPNCGIDLEKGVICSCAATGNAIHEALVNVISTHAKDINPDYRRYLELHEKYGIGEPHGPV